ncbi:DUF2063 domain-containing protein [Alishewanella longhuensis]|uniref:DUF2063 domain-containing protein n=1 Tax=Alishewanella longhuensis TaxID=1091037 RepID=A0ABQ3L5L6_9ALTE|nr:putative DNA-binding domain-containing protein [Alishewanella longhuensis]GHG73429.1 DUF2063 domain-containing protein [Alishewanella longhuensis]
MSALSETQLAFANYIRDPAQYPAPEAIEIERLEVYRELFFNNVRGFLDNAFPVLHSLYPADAWLTLQQQFFAGYACQSPYFLHIAEQFVSFLQQYPLTAQDPPFLTELAHYEWAELYIGTKQARHSLQRLAPVELTTSSLALSELAMLAAYQYPVQRISNHFQPSTAGDLQCFLIYRDYQDEVIFVSLNQATLLLLNQLSEKPGQTLSELTQALAPSLAPLTPAQLEAAALPLLQELAAKGAIVPAFK